MVSTFKSIEFVSIAEASDKSKIFKPLDSTIFDENKHIARFLNALADKNEELKRLRDDSAHKAATVLITVIVE